MASQSHQVSAVDDIVSEYQGIEAQMSDPETVGDQALFRKLSKRYSELQPIMKVNTALEQARADLADAKEMAYEDSEFAPEADRLAGEVVELEEKLADLLAPRDPHDGDDIVMEIKAGAGGEEAALFAGELVRMYQRYADKHGFSTEVLGLSESDLGGVKDMTLSIRSKQPSRDGAWSVFKFEGGVHRVQRTRHRIPRPNPNLRRRCPRLPRTRRNRRRRNRRQRHPRRRLPILRQRRPRRQYH